MASQDATTFPSHPQLIHFLADFHGLDDRDVSGHMFQHSDVDAARHLFTVAASLDSMVVGEAQILSQVKQAFAAAQEQQMTGPVMHLAFEAANRVAKRVATETDINRRRVSIPSVAVADFAKQLFETFHDKHVLLFGAGEMGEETLRYLRDEGARRIVILNRSASRAEALAARVEAEVDVWERLDSPTRLGRPGRQHDRCSRTDGHRRALPEHSPSAHRTDSVHPGPGGTARFRSGHRAIQQRVSLLHRRSEATRANATALAREEEWPKAQQIVEEETARFVADVNHRATGPTIQRLKQQADELKSDELRRLLNKLGDIDGRTREEIERSFERLVNKLLHPPLESLRDEASRGSPHRLLDALRHLFQITD